MAVARKALAGIAILALVLLTGYFAAHEYVRALAFIAQAASVGGAPELVAEWEAQPVRAHELRVPWRGGDLRARWYASEPAAGPPILVVPGVHAAGIDEPRLTGFATNLASVGHPALAVELPDLMRYRVTPRTTDMIEDAASWLSRQAELAPEGRVGLIGISFAGGLSLVAAGRQPLASGVAFVMSFGGHGDLPRTLRYLLTGVQPDGSQRPPHDYGVAVILLGVADRVVPPAQVEPLRDAILTFLAASHTDMVDKAAAQIEFARAREMGERLDEPARTLMRYVNDRNVEQLGPILLPHVSAIAGNPALSPSRAPAPVSPVYLLHGADDNVVPAIESALLAENLRAHGVRVRFLATPLVTHAEVDNPAAVGDILALVRFWAGLMSEE